MECELRAWPHLPSSRACRGDHGESALSRVEVRRLWLQLRRPKSGRYSAAEFGEGETLGRVYAGVKIESYVITVGLGLDSADSLE
jgi:hypothetical protein